jgi:hypothetical protein
MKKSKKVITIDAVKLMREIRDSMSDKMKNMSAAEQIKYIEKLSGIKKKTHKPNPMTHVR